MTPGESKREAKERTSRLIYFQVTLRIWDSLFCSGRDVLIKVYLVVVRLKFSQGLKVKEATDYYTLLNETPGQIHTPSHLFMVILSLPHSRRPFSFFFFFFLILSYFLFQEVYKHFLHLYQVEKMRANAQKAISNAINKREELRLRSHTHCMSREMREGWRGREGEVI